MKWTKVREKVAAVAAILFLIVIGVIVAAYFGVNIPILSDLIGGAIG